MRQSPLQPTDAFAWVQAPGGPALVCRPLERFASHLFTTRHWRLGSQAEADSASWRQVAAAIGVDLHRLARLHQVHGATAVVAQPSSQPHADIVVSDDAEIALAVQTADCVPILIADVRTGAVAAAHAGWRGLAARVPQIAVEKMKSTFGSRPADLIAAAGPSIGACCYEVGEDVYARFASAGFGAEDLARCFLPKPQPTTRNPSMPALSPMLRAGHWYFDGWSATKHQLATAGVPNHRIHIAALCTASNPDILCSYRRFGQGCGRMAAAIIAGSAIQHET
jgi:polyphenol oxidase